MLYNSGEVGVRVRSRAYRVIRVIIQIGTDTDRIIRLDLQNSTDKHARRHDHSVYILTLV